MIGPSRETKNVEESKRKGEKGDELRDAVAPRSRSEKKGADHRGTIIRASELREGETPTIPQKGPFAGGESAGKWGQGETSTI